MDKKTPLPQVAVQYIHSLPETLFTRIAPPSLWHLIKARKPQASSANFAKAERRVRPNLLHPISTCRTIRFQEFSDVMSNTGKPLPYVPFFSFLLKSSRPKSGSLRSSVSFAYRDKSRMVRVVIPTPDVIRFV